VSVVVVDSHAVGRANEDHGGSERIAGLCSRELEQGLPSEARRIDYFQLLVARGGNGLLCYLPNFGVRHVEQFRSPGTDPDPFPQQQCSEVRLPEAARRLDAADHVMQRLVVLVAGCLPVLLQRYRESVTALFRDQARGPV